MNKVNGVDAKFEDTLAFVGFWCRVHECDVINVSDETPIIEQEEVRDGNMYCKADEEDLKIRKDHDVIMIVLTNDNKYEIELPN